MPTEWADIVGPGMGVLDVTIEQVDASTLVVTAGGTTVRCRPITPDDAEFLCA